tara:strand:+ start:2771 stop:3085 length:315 start_codon:yes stop_codon:yes gene_type:complete
MSDEMKQIEEAQAKLAKMEEDLKGQADLIDQKEKELTKREEKLQTSEEKFSKKVGIVDASSVFDTMVSTVNSLYTSYYAIKGTDEGLLEAIQSILQARQSINKQ